MKPSAAEANRLRREAEEGEVLELGSDFFERARVRGEVIREAGGTLTRRGRARMAGHFWLARPE